MHRSLLSKSVLLIRAAKRPSILSSWAGLGPVRSMPPARQLSSSPPSQSTDNHAPSPTESPSTSSSVPPPAKLNQGELERELESVPPPSSTHPQTTDAAAEVVSVEGLILEEIGRTPDQQLPSVDAASVVVDPSVSADASATPEVPPGRLTSGQLVLSRHDFDRRLVSAFASAPAASRYEIFDPDEDAVLPTINYFALWPGVSAVDLGKELIAKLIVSAGGSIDTPRPAPRQGAAAADTSSVPSSNPEDSTSTPPPSPPALTTASDRSAHAALVPAGFSVHHAPSLPVLRRAHRFLDTSRKHGKRNQPHITLHHNTLVLGRPPEDPAIALWDRFSFLAFQPSSPTYTVTYSHLLWDADNLMVLVVDSIALDVKEGMDDEYVDLWTLPPVVPGRFHMTVKINPNKVGTHAAGEMMRRWRVLDEEKKGVRVGEGWLERARKERWGYIEVVNLLGDGVEGKLGGFQARFAAKQVD